MMRSRRQLGACCAALLFGCGWAVSGQAQDGAPLIEEGDTLRTAEHVHVILDDNRGLVPNVGIVVGDRATLIVDTGLGLQNGAIVLAEARKLSDNEEFFIVSTHYHPEHDLGAGAFSADSSTMLRSREQHADYEAIGMSVAETFAQRGPVVANLLQGAAYRPADVLFDDAYSVDLGGVTVRLQAAGPAHTAGDTLVHVVEDRVLFVGDIAQQRYPRFAGADSGIAVWLQALDLTAGFEVGVLVPSHGPLGDVATIAVNRDFFSTVQTRVGELKAQGRSEAEITEILTAELPPRFADWPAEGIARIANAVTAAFSE